MSSYRRGSRREEGGGGRSGDGSGGYCLGGGGGGINDSNLSRDELRQRRLAALSGSNRGVGGGGSESGGGGSSRSKPPPLKPANVVSGGERRQPPSPSPPPLGSSSNYPIEMTAAADTASSSARGGESRNLKNYQEEEEDSMEYEYETDHELPSTTEEDEEDEDLKRAMALSLRHIDYDDRDHSDVDDDDDNDNGEYRNRDTNQKPKEYEVQIKESVVVDSDLITKFHSIMWDDLITTPSDKERWLGQGICTSALAPKNNDDDDEDAATMDVDNEPHASPQPPPSVLLSDCREGRTATTKTEKTMFTDNNDNVQQRLQPQLLQRQQIRKPNNKKSPLDILTHGNSEGYKMWGLTQLHGGPCGVLAAVQAEMLRLLLFGRFKNSCGGRRIKRNKANTTTTNATDDEEEEDESSLFYPTHLSLDDHGDGGDEENNDENGKSDHVEEQEEGHGDDEDIITTELVRVALAKAVAIILARAAVMPPAVASSSISPHQDEEGGKNNLEQTMMMKPTGQNDSNDDEEVCVRLLIPATTTKYNGLKWNDLAPWSPSSVSSSSSIGSTLHHSSNLRMYTIRLVPSSPQKDTDSNNSNNNKSTPESKRQKVKKSSSSLGVLNDCEDNNNHNHISSCERKMIQLANAVSTFLLHGLNDKEQSHRQDNQERNDASSLTPSLSSPPPLTTTTTTSRPPLYYLHKPGGVILLTMSLVSTRSAPTIRSEMDDPDGTRLTSQFGHCSQELINLLLTGQSVSNVFDNTVTIGGALTCRGIQYRPYIGYLSQLESLRYCEVGAFYKNPKFPIWVVGSTNHFTVLFGDTRCLHESKSDLLLERVRRAFKSVEGGEENGFIDVTALHVVLDKLHLMDKVGGESGVQTLAAALEVSGAGIILWDDFWKASSRLLTGASLQSVLQGHNDDDGVGAERNEGHSGRGGGGGDENQQPPLLLTQYGEGGRPPSPAGDAVTGASLAGNPQQQYVDLTQLESDEELARKLAAEWGTADVGPPPLELTEHVNSSMWGSSVTAGGGDSTTTQQKSSSSGMHRVKTDEELARELQAQWDAEDAGTLGDRSGTDRGLVNTSDGSTHAVNNADAKGVGAVAAPSSFTHQPSSSSIPALACDNEIASFDEAKKGADVSMATAALTEKAAAPSTTKSNIDGEMSSHKHNFEFEKYGDTFPLYHYNGLRGGCLTSFNVTRLTPEEAVGMSIAISSHSGHGGDGGTGGGSGSRSTSTSVGQGGAVRREGGDLEDVVRTKWPSCMFDWGRSSPPYID